MKWAEKIFKLQKRGLLISQISSKAGKEHHVINEILKISSKFRKKDEKITNDFTVKNEKTITNYYDFYYNPQIYYTFGPFSITCIEIIDDLSILSFYSRIEDITNRQFILAAIPEIDEKGFYDNHLLNSTPYHETTKKHPLVAHAQLKINPVLKIFLGQEIFKNIYADTSKLLSKQISSNMSTYAFMPLCWSDILITIHSDNFKIILETIHILRHLTLNNLNIDMHKLSLAKKKLHDKLGSGLLNNSNHVFSNTYTSLGFRHEIYFQENKITTKSNSPPDFNPITDKEEIHAYSRISYKPGHLNQLKTFIDSRCNKNNVKPHNPLFFGKYDLLLTENDICSNIGDCDSINTKIFIEFFCKFYHKITTINPKLVNICNTEIELPNTKKGCSSDHNNLFTPFYNHIKNSIIPTLDKKDEMAHLLKEFSITKNEGSIVIDNTLIDLLLKSLLFPKKIRLSLLELNNIFKNSLSDPTLFTSFLELLPSLQMLNLKLVKNLCTIMDCSRYPEKYDNPNEINELIFSLPTWMLKCIRYIEEGINNRILSGYVTKEITDYKTRIPGNYIRMLSAVDGFCYASTCFVENPHTVSCCTTIGHYDSPSIHISFGAIIHLDWFHLLQPEHLIRIQHEIGHYMLKNKKFYKIYKYINEYSVMHFSNSQRRNYKDYSEELFAHFWSYLFGFLGDSDLFLSYHLIAFEQKYVLKLNNATFPNETYNIFNWQFSCFLLPVLILDRKLIINRNNPKESRHIDFISFMELIKPYIKRHHNNSTILSKYHDLLKKDNHAFDKSKLAKQLYDHFYYQLSKYDSAILAQKIYKELYNLYKDHFNRDSELKNFRDKIYNNFKTCFTQGYAVTSKDKRTKSRFTTANALIYSVWRLIYEKYLYQNNPFLLRKMGNPHSDNQHGYLFYQEGGSFCGDINIRSELLKLRMIVLHSLSMISDDGKIELLDYLDT